MVTAWQVPQNPLNDPTLVDARLADQIKWGFRIFTDTPHEAPRFTGGKVSCSNCHLNAGQRERALPVVGVAGMFPEYNGRAARLISLNDRIVDCFLRSENATGRLGATEASASSLVMEREAFGRRSPDDVAKAAGERQLELPTPTSKEVLAVAARTRRGAAGTRLPRIILFRSTSSIDRAAKRSTASDARRVMARTARAFRSATRKPARCGAPIRGTTAPARHACTRSPESSATRCPIWIPEASRTKTHSTSRRSSLRSRDRRTPSRIAIIQAGKFQSTRCTTSRRSADIPLGQSLALFVARATSICVHGFVRRSR